MGTGFARARKHGAVAVAAVVGMVVGGAAVGYSSITTTKASGGAITAVRVVRDSNNVSTASTTFIDVPNAKTKINVAAGTKALIIARFSATSTCEGTSNNGCEVRILIGGVEAQPAGINASVFDSGTDASSGDSREAHMIERSLGPLGAGSYTVEAQMAVPNNAVTLALANWNLTVERANA